MASISLQQQQKQLQQQQNIKEEKSVTILQKLKKSFSERVSC
jgi:hypothetical protein